MTFILIPLCSPLAISYSGESKIRNAFCARRTAPGVVHLRIVLFMADGYISNETEILAAIEDKLGDARLFSLFNSKQRSLFFSTYFIYNPTLFPINFHLKRKATFGIISKKNFRLTLSEFALEGWWTK